MHLYTYRLANGGYVTYAGHTEPDAFRRAYTYYGANLIGIEPIHHVCACTDKVAESVRQAGWLICARRECAGYLR
jgi:hypothetical protein